MSIAVRLNLLGALEVRDSDLIVDASQVGTLDVLIDTIDRRNPGFKEAIVDRSGEISPRFVFFINGRNSAYLAGTKTRLVAGDVVNVIPAIAGG